MMFLTSIYTDTNNIVDLFAALLYNKYIHMENFKYFNFGYPKYPWLPIYGLYQPILDRFIAVAPDLSSATKLQAILSSRYISYIICLNTAENFQPKLVDNSVCDQWTLEDKTQIPVTLGYSNKLIYISGNLIPAVKTIDWDLHEEKRWIFLCLYWIIFFQSKEEYDNKTFNMIDSELKDLIESENLVYQSQADFQTEKLEIMKLLYLGRNFDLIEQQINTIVDQSDMKINYD